MRGEPDHRPEGGDGEHHERELHEDGHAARHPDRGQDDLSEQRVLLGLRQERRGQDPDAAGAGLVWRGVVPGHVQDPRRADRRRADAPVVRGLDPVGGQRGRWHLAALRAQREPEGRHRLPDVGDHVGRLPGQTGPGVSGVYGGGEDVVDEPGRLGLLRGRHLGATGGRGERGVAGVGVWAVQPGGGLGGHGHPGAERGEEHRVAAAGVAEFDRELRARRRVPGHDPVSTTTDGGRVGARGVRRALWPGRSGHAFVAAYVLLLIAFGLVPTGYAIYFAFTDAGGHLSALSNFTSAYQDFRFVPAIGHVALYLLFWLASLVVFVVALALLLHRLSAKGVSKALRFLYYIPGALAGAAGVMVWLFLLDPSVSPISFLLRALGYQTFGDVIAPGHLPVLFTLIAFWTGAGGWIVVMYGALNNIPLDVIEAARIDGAGAWKTALHIQIPLLRKWIV